MTGNIYFCPLQWVWFRVGDVDPHGDRLREPREHRPGPRQLQHRARRGVQRGEVLHRRGRAGQVGGK